MFSHRIFIGLILLSGLSWAQGPLPAVKVTHQETRRSGRHDLEVKVSVDVVSVGDSSKAELIPVSFTVKNISMAGISLAHYGDDYTQNVEILRADKVEEENTLFPLAGAGGGSAKEIAPGASLSFVVPVPIALFRMKGVQFIAGVRYGMRIGDNEAFEGEALSEPFSLPPIPAQLAPPPGPTPKGTPQPPTPSKPVPTVVPAPTSSALAVIESPVWGRGQLLTLDSGSRDGQRERKRWRDRSELNLPGRSIM
jgi:hypothetical protein